MYRPYSSSQADFRPLADVQSQLRDLTQDFTTSFNTGNYDQAATLFASDGVLMAPQYEGAYGQKAVSGCCVKWGRRDIATCAWKQHAWIIPGIWRWNWGASR